MKKVKIDLKDIDFKQFFIEKGERVGIWTATGVLVLLLALAVLSACTSDISASKNQQMLADRKQKAQNAITTSTPGEGESQLPDELKRAVNPTPVVPQDYSLSRMWFMSVGSEDRKWRRPDVLSPDEFAIELVRGPVLALIIEGDEKDLRLGILQDVKDSADPKKNQELASRVRRKMRLQIYNPPPQGGGRRGGPMGGGMGGAMGGGMGGAMGGGMGGPMGGGMGGPAGGAAGRGQSSQITTQVKMVAADKVDKYELANTILPFRAAMISAAFPLKAQYEVYRRALHFPSLEEMMADEDARPVFLGYDVQRRTLSLEGKVLSDWADLDYQTPMKNVRVRAVATEPEDPALKTYRIIQEPNRLVMPRPQFAPERGEKYPDLKLQSIQDALAAMEKANKGNMPPPEPTKSRFNEVNPFDEAREEGTGRGGNAAGGAPGGGGFPGGGGGAGQPGGMPGGGGGQPGGMPGGGSHNAPAFNPSQVPDKCLIRFFDPTVEPGKAYEYRIRVRMENPNYEKPDRAVSADLTSSKDIVAEEWKVVSSKVDGKEVPLRVSVPVETLLYAVDDNEQNRGVQPNADRAAVQIQRWLDHVPTDPAHPTDSLIPVGDWSMEQRLLIHRGDYIGRWDEVPVPVWEPAARGFVLASAVDARGRMRRRGLPVDFNTRAILVDFEGGKQTYVYNGKSQQDTAPVEMLVYTPDGKLLVHSERIDKEDAERKERTKSWKDWVAKVQEKGHEGRGGAAGSNRGNEDLFQKRNKER